MKMALPVKHAPALSFFSRYASNLSSKSFPKRQLSTTSVIMGTRGLLGVVRRNGSKKATYNHYDSYPIGLGVAIAKFILSLNPEQIIQMAEKMERITWVSDKNKPSAEEEALYVKSGLADTDVNVKRTDDWYCLLHKAQNGAALPLILDGTLDHLLDKTEFEKNTVLCEWTYYIDWHKQTLEVKQNNNDSIEAIEDEVTFADLSVQWMNVLQSESEEAYDSSES